MEMPVIVRESSISRGAAVGLAAAGIGVLVLLVCWGISLFSHNGLAERVENALDKQTTSLGGKLDAIVNKPDRIDEVLAKLDSVVTSLRARIDEYNASSMSSISRQLDAIQSQIYDLKSKSPIIVPPQAKGEDPKIIQTEVTVFKSVEHEGGRVHTGWTYPNGGSADSPPNFNSATGALSRCQTLPRSSTSGLPQMASSFQTSRPISQISAALSTNASGGTDRRRRGSRRRRRSRRIVRSVAAAGGSK